MKARSAASSLPERLLIRSNSARLSAVRPPTGEGGLLLLMIDLFREGAFRPPAPYLAVYHKGIVSVEERRREAQIVVSYSALAAGQNAPTAPGAGCVAGDEHSVQKAQQVGSVVARLERFDDRAPASYPSRSLFCRGRGVVEAIDQVPTVSGTVLEIHFVPPLVGTDLESAVSDG